MTPPTHAEQVSYDRFIDTLMDGRQALREKRFDDALRSFGEAQGIQPWDPRPLFERGNVRVVDKKYDLARLDLESARERATNVGLATQVMFDLGTVRAALGDAEGARACYVAIQRLKPSQLAAGRLGQQSTCDADVDRRKVPGLAARDWLAAWNTLAADYVRDHAPLDLPPIADADAARAALCAGGCEGAGPWVASIGADEKLLALVAPKGPGLVLFPRIGRSLGGDCAWTDAITIDAATTPARVHVRRGARERVFFKDNEIGNEVICEDSLKGCEWRCAPEGWMERDSFFDLAAGTRVLAVEQVGRLDMGAGPIVGVARKGQSVIVRGAGCEATIAL